MEIDTNNEEKQYTKIDILIPKQYPDYLIEFQFLLMMLQHVEKDALMFKDQ